MIRDFAFYWNNNKDRLAEYMKNHEVDEYADSYLSLVKLIFDEVINPDFGRLSDKFNTDDDEISEIDNGDYQGSLIYLLHIDSYQPSPDDYVFTTVNYGSCSGCDTLLGITSLVIDGYPNDSQVDDLMMLCLQLIENCHWLIPREE